MKITKAEDQTSIPIHHLADGQSVILNDALGVFVKIGKWEKDSTKIRCFHFHPDSQLPTKVNFPVIDFEVVPCRISEITFTV